MCRIFALDAFPVQNIHEDVLMMEHVELFHQDYHIPLENESRLIPESKIFTASVSASEMLTWGSLEKFRQRINVVRVLIL